MVELTSARKNKITLADYNYRSDLDNRLLMAAFSHLDLEVLEELLYSSLTIPLSKLADSMGLKEKELLPSLEKFSKAGLLSLDKETIIVDKEMRKYYESQIQKFDDTFIPGLEYLQGLLRKVPIHILPTWYSVPRTSNNIIESLIEKYLQTPQTFQRYLAELNFGDPVLTGILQDLLQSPDYKLSADAVMQKYQLSHEQFEENMLLLEFNFVCCLGYNKVGKDWKEVITPFEEWRNYVIFLRDTETKPLKHQSKVQPTRPQDFSFILDMSALLQLARKEALPLAKSSDGELQLTPKALTQVVARCEGLVAGSPFAENYVKRLIAKLHLLKYVDVVEGKLYALEGANDWLDLNLENRALTLYRHPHNHILNDSKISPLCTERNVHECEKSIIRVLASEWVYFDEFLKGVLVTLSENSIITLKKTGKGWKYTLPQYTDEENAVIKATIFDWLFEIGIVSIGTHEGRECFRVTPFGQSFYET